MATFPLIIAVALVKIHAPWASFVLNAIFRERKATFGIFLCHVRDFLTMGVEEWCPYAVSVSDAAGRVMEVCADLTDLYEEIGNRAAATVFVRRRGICER